MSSESFSLSTEKLLTEYTQNPIGIDEPTPRFSWVPIHSSKRQVQTAYRVIVSTSLENALNGIGDLWDSGFVRSDFNLAIYGGPALKSFTKYFWRVKWWDRDGKESPWSDVAFFETGPLGPEDWGGAVWIGGGQMLRTEFKLDDEVAEARAYVSGLGYYELRINGTRIGDRILDPPWSVYDKRIYYSTYDVTDLLRKGGNAIGIILGRGRFSPRYYEKFRTRYYGEPKAILLLRMVLRSGREVSIVTSEGNGWRCLENGPILDDDIYNGYRYDSRLEPKGWDLPGFDDATWTPCIRSDPPSGRLSSASTIPATKVKAMLRPQRVYSTRPGVLICDFGQNLVGWVRLRINSPLRGAMIRIRYSELIGPSGELDRRNLRGAEAEDIFILRGDEHFVEPRFTYHGFRYVEIQGYPGTLSIDDVEALVVYADLERVGSFVCNDHVANDIHRLSLWSFKGNLNNGVITDCPQRDERMGWLGDAWLSAEAIALNFDVLRYYEKFILDIMDSQRDDGSISDVAPPYWELYPADPAWGTALIYIPWVLYTYYGDKKVLEKTYNAMKKWWEYLYGRMRDGILYFGKYGDWVPPGRVRALENSPPEIVATWIMYRDAKILAKVAKIIGRESDVGLFEERAMGIGEAFNREFLRTIVRDSSTIEGYYASYRSRAGEEVMLGGTQTCNALALAEDLVPKERKSRIIEQLVRSVEIEWDRHINVGILGAAYVPQVLAENGYEELAYEAITQESYPGYGYMVREGATTLWERWERLEGGGMNSHNHHMLGSVDAWLYKYVAGIKILEPGFKKILVKIPKISRIRHAAASYKSIRGVFNVTWSRSEDSLRIDITLPVGSTAIIQIPIEGEASEFLESGKLLWSFGKLVEKPEDVLSITEKRDKTRLLEVEIGSGSYSFELKYFRHK
jgi:alpha-L-rhamnosidase